VGAVAHNSVVVVVVFFIVVGVCWLLIFCLLVYCAVVPALSIRKL